MREALAFPSIGYFGGCPRCGKNDGYRNIGREHWFFCSKHQTKWCFGINVFSGWKGETPAEWLRNEGLLAGYRIVEPVEPGGDPSHNAAGQSLT